MSAESKGQSSTSFLDRLSNASIWWFAFGYFACYVPYSLMARAISRGMWWGTNGVKIPGAQLLPLSLSVSAIGMAIFLFGSGLWRYAHQWKVGPLSIPRPSRGTFLSGLCTATIIATTTLAYTFKGISIVFAMLLMRGGVLMIAPIVDALSGRKTRWFAWVGLFLSFMALVVAFWEGGSTSLNVAASVDIGLYLAAYFVRLRLMSSMAKSDDTSKQWQYFAEEQIVGVSASFLFVAVVAALGWGSLGVNLAKGFSLFDGGSILLGVLLIGLFSQGTGIFGGLILLNKQENTFCVPVNRSSSILAGVLSSLLLTWFFHAPSPSPYKLAGAGLIIGAILVLSIPPLLEKQKAKKNVANN